MFGNILHTVSHNLQKYNTAKIGKKSNQYAGKADFFKKYNALYFTMMDLKKTSASFQTV